MNFENIPPDKVSVKDILFKPNGDFLFTNKEIAEVSLKNSYDYYSFIVTPHKCSMLKSVNTDDYRGFTISAFWGKDEYISAFVIKTYA